MSSFFGVIYGLVFFIAIVYLLKINFSKDGRTETEKPQIEEIKRV